MTKRSRFWPKGFFSSKPKPKKFSPRPKLSAVRKKNAERNKPYKKWWPNL